MTEMWQAQMLALISAIGVVFFIAGIVGLWLAICSIIRRNEP